MIKLGQEDTLDLLDPDLFGCHVWSLHNDKITISLLEKLESSNSTDREQNYVMSLFLYSIWK